MHGTSGWRRGCRCGRCRTAHTEDNAARRRAAKVIPLDPEAEAGPLESALIAEIEALAGDVQWTHAMARLERQALIAARIVDVAVSSGRLSLCAVQNRVIHECVDRLAALIAAAKVKEDPVPAGSGDGLDEDGPITDLDRFVESLTKMPRTD